MEVNCAPPLILAVDLGTSALKVALVSVAGQVVGWEREPLELVLGPDGGCQQRPRDWWEAFLSAAERLLGKAHGARGRVMAVCCSTHGEGTVAVDEQGQPLCDAILWMDMRGAPSLRRQLGGGLQFGGTRLTKLARFVWLTGGAPSMSGKDPAGHILWLRDVHPAIYEKTHKFLNVLDYMNFRLSGRLVATRDSIVTTWVTDNRRPDAIRYHDGLIRMLGIDREKLPDLVACTDVIGTLRQDVAQHLGLDPAVRVVAGAIDNTAAAVGAGAVADFRVHLYIGTSSWFAAHVPFKRTDLRTRLASIPCAVPGRYLMTALQATAGGNVTFVRDNLLQCRDELGCEREPPDLFRVLDTMVQRVPAGASGLIYTPWIWGERAPFEDSAVRGGLYHLSLHHTRAHVLRAVLEGVAMNARSCLPSIERFLGRAVGPMHLVGGGAQSNAWCQILADVLQVEMKQLHQPVAANARGAAWIAAVGLGRLTFADIPQLVCFQRCFSPDPATRELYDQRIELFQEIYRRMKPIHRALDAAADDRGGHAAEIGPADDPRPGG